MTLAATVVVPTHDHGPTLLRSVPSALAQTIAELEVFVVGDGVPSVTREVITELAASDERVKFFDNPKGPRHGEVHRHEALKEARGKIVCYLSDDDLWLPDHVEELQELLANADFAHTRPLWIDTEGRPHPWLVDLGRLFYRELLLSGENRVPHACAGHTLEVYRRLPAGWRTTPAGTPTDLYMWQQILSLPDCRAVSGSRPTVLHFPSPARTGWSIEERLAELDSWVPRLADPALGPELAVRLLDTTASVAETLEEDLHGKLVDADLLDARVREVDEERAALSRRLDDLAGQLHQVDTERALLSARLSAASATSRRPLLPRLGGLVRWAARARAARAGSEATDSPHRARTRGPTPPAKGSPTRDRPSDN